jgi:ABC-type Fe3+/spermidine/putrescine transport system ATPase subunit
MHNGLIERFDTPRELFERPKTPIVADLLGAANLPAGRIKQHTDRHTGIRLDNSGGLLKARRHDLASCAQVKFVVQPGRLRACATGGGFGTGTVETVTDVGALIRAAYAASGDLAEVSQMPKARKTAFQSVGPGQAGTRRRLFPCGIAGGLGGCRGRAASWSAAPRLP